MEADSSDACWAELWIVCCTRSIRVEHVCTDVSVVNSKIAINAQHIRASIMHTGKELNARKSGGRSRGPLRIMMDTREERMLKRNIRYDLPCSTARLQILMK